MDIELIKAKLDKEAKENGFFPTDEMTYISLLSDLDVTLYITDYGVTFNGDMNAVIRTFDYILKGFSNNPDYEKVFFKESLKYFKEV